MCQPPRQESSNLNPEDRGRGPHRPGPPARPGHPTYQMPTVRTTREELSSPGPGGTPTPPVSKALSVGGLPYASARGASNPRHAGLDGTSSQTGVFLHGDAHTTCPTTLAKWTRRQRDLANLTRGKHGPTSCFPAGVLLLPNGLSSTRIDSPSSQTHAKYPAPRTVPKGSVPKTEYHIHGRREPAGHGTEVPTAGASGVAVWSYEWAVPVGPQGHAGTDRDTAESTLLEA